MGLFKKRVTDPQEIERLKAEIAAMGARLNATEDAKSELDTTVRGLVTRLDAPTPAPPPPPTGPTATAANTAEIDMLNAKIERLASRVDEARTDDGAASIDPDEVRQLVTRVDDLGQRLEHTGDTATPPAVDSAEVEQLTARIDELGRRLDAAAEAPTPAGIDPAELQQLHTKIDGVVERISQLDDRISSISTELANQINELSGEIDGMERTPGVTDELVDELRDAQTRLAGEQARYQIAFRQDLADLADRLKRA